MLFSSETAARIWSRDEVVEVKLHPNPAQGAEQESQSDSGGRLPVHYHRLQFVGPRGMG